MSRAHANRRDPSSGWISAQRAEECEPLDHEERANAERMKQRAAKWLSKARDGEQARQKRGTCPKERKCERERRWRCAQKRRDEHAEGENLSAEEKHGSGPDQLRRAESLVSVSREATPHVSPRRIHSTDGDVGGVEEVSCKAGRAEDPRRVSGRHAACCGSHCAPRTHDRLRGRRRKAVRNRRCTPARDDFAFAGSAEIRAAQNATSGISSRSEKVFVS